MVLKQDAVLERLMPALDLVLRLPVAGRAVHVTPWFWPAGLPALV